MRHLFGFVNNLRLRWKMLVVVLPLVIVPIFLVGSIIGYVASRQAYRGITQTSKDDLDHMAGFTIDLLNSHYQQFQVYKQDKEKSFRQELASLANLAASLVEAEARQVAEGRLARATAAAAASRAIRRVNVGESGYLYAMTGNGLLTAHPAREGENVLGERDENGRLFIREMCEK
ncbi:MAG TPA: cache domain-containing protein, partial [Geobacteraceae bacterium]